MGIPKLEFTADQDPATFQLYEALLKNGVTSAELDRGYTVVNHAGLRCPRATDRTCTKGKQDSRLTSEEVWDYAFAREQEYRQLIEGLVNLDLPWVLDDGNPQTTFDEQIRKRVTDALGVLKQALRKQGITEGSKAYTERLAVGMFHLVADRDIQSMSAELNGLGLREYAVYLERAGRFQIGAEYGGTLSALEALRTQRGDCTELAQILYGVLVMAGFEPLFVDIDLWKAKSTTLREEMRLAYLRYNVEGHVAIALNLNGHLRILDPSFGESNAQYDVFSLLAKRPYLASYVTSLAREEGEMRMTQQALALDPLSWEAFRVQGILMGQDGDLEGELESYGRALLINPNDPETLNNRCYVLMLKAQMRAALADCNRALTVRPDHPQALANRSVLWRYYKKWDAMIADCTRAVALQPDNPACYANRSWAYAMRGEFQKALADLDTRIRLQQGDPEATYQNLLSHAMLWEMQKQWGMAAEDYTRAISLLPRRAAAYWRRGEMYYHLGDWKKAIADSSKTFTLLRAPKDYMYVFRAHAFRRLGAPHEAIADLTKALEINPNNAQALLQRARTYEQLGRLDTALEDYHTLIQQVPDHAGAQLRQAALIAKTKDRQTAEQELVRYLRISPRQSPSARAAVASALRHWMEGDLGGEASHFLEAERIWEQTAITGQDVAASFYVSGLLWTVGDKKRALHELTALVDAVSGEVSPFMVPEDPAGAFMNSCWTLLPMTMRVHKTVRHTQDRLLHFLKNPPLPK